MTNKPNQATRRQFAWHFGNTALRDIGRIAREKQQRRRDDAAQAKKDGERVVRPLLLTREDHNAAQRKARGW